MEKERYRFFETVIQDTEYQNTDAPQSLMDKTLCCIRLNEQDARIKELEEQNGYIIFADGYDDNGNKVSKQVYTTYKSKCDELIKENKQLKERIKELEELLKTAREFETPRISRYAVVQYSHWKNRPYKIVKCYDCYKDKDMKIVYCYYGVKSSNFKVIKICDTEEEANSLIKELRENSCNG